MRHRLAALFLLGVLSLLLAAHSLPAHLSAQRLAHSLREEQGAPPPPSPGPAHA